VLKARTASGASAASSPDTRADSGFVVEMWPPGRE
jgi:hypothetical protein